MRKSIWLAILAGMLSLTIPSGAHAASTYTVINRTGASMRVCVGTFSGSTCSKVATVANGARRAGVHGTYAEARYGLRYNSGGWYYGPRWLGTTASPGTYTITRKASAAQRILGTPRSGGRWHSGAWTGAPFTVAEIESFGAWRGSPPDLVTAYSHSDHDWNELATNFWSISVYRGFRGRLNYGLAPIPSWAEPQRQNDSVLTAAETEVRRKNMREVASGKRDYVFRAQAQALKQYGHGDAIVRIAWEATYLGWKHSANYSLRNDYKAMWRRVAQVMNQVSPALVFEFNTAGGHRLAGSSARLAGLTDIYPGDDVVDIVGLDLYDWYSSQTYGSDASRMLHPPGGPGVLDTIQFARKHGKGFAYSEWGLSSAHGSGDNPAYISAVWKVLNDNRDVVAADAYFDDGQHDFRGNGFTKSGAVYRGLW